METCNKCPEEFRTFSKECSDAIPGRPPLHPSAWAQPDKTLFVKPIFLPDGLSVRPAMDHRFHPAKSLPDRDRIGVFLYKFPHAPTGPNPICGAAKLHRFFA